MTIRRGKYASDLIKNGSEIRFCVLQRPRRFRGAVLRRTVGFAENLRASPCVVAEVDQLTGDDR